MDSITIKNQTIEIANNIGRTYMATKIWVGKRESDIMTYEYFDISITYWGSNTGKNCSFCTTNRTKDTYSNAFTQFVLKKLEFYINQQNSSDIEIHFYNNSFAYKLIKIDPSLKKYIVNMNSQRIFDIVRHKTLSRVWLQNTVNVPDFTYLSKNECQYNQIIDKFPGHKRFVVQKSISGGGDGTYLIHTDNWEQIISVLDSNDIYLVSPYYENNLSLSCHLLIDNNQVIVFPVSEQLLNYENNKISYCGNRYLDIRDRLSMNIKKMAITVGHKLRSIDYRGVCGLDFIFVDNRIMLIEINPRYQGSSYTINAELKRMNLPPLFSLNKMSFDGCIKKEIVNKIETMNIAYGTHNCTYKKGWTSSEISCPTNARLFLDGVLNACTFANDVYLYRYLVENK